MANKAVRAKVAISFLLFLFFISVPLFAQEKRNSDYYYVNDTEYFGIRFEGGSHGAGAMFSLPTLRWHQFYWEILRGGFNLGGSGDTGLGGIYYILGGTSFGGPFFLDKACRHELRAGVGAFGGVVLSHNQNVGYFALNPELSFVYHIRRHVAFTMGITSYMALPNVRATAISVFAGMRF